MRAERLGRVKAAAAEGTDETGGDVALSITYSVSKPCHGLGGRKTGS